MGSRGFPASGDKTKGHKATNRRILSSNGALLGPAIPKGLLGIDADGKEIPWHPRAEKWYENFRRSPQATLLLTEPEWDVIIENLMLVHSYWTEPTVAKAAEMRARMKAYAVTPEDRARLHIDIDVPDNKSIGNPDRGNPVGDNVASFAEAAALAAERHEELLRREAERLNKQG